MSYRLSFERAEQQLDLIHALLSGAYWSRDVVERAIAGSFCMERHFVDLYTA